jgi:hypothetical protein
MHHKRKKLNGFLFAMLRCVIVENDIAVNYYVIDK